jgi:hypothetical protein
MKRAEVTVLALWVACAVCALACGGAVSGSGGGGANDGGASSSGGSGTSGGSGSSGGSASGSGSGGSSCPSSPPAQGAACSPACEPSTSPTCLTCEWGTSVDPSCNDQATCANGAWQVRGHTPGDCKPGTPGAMCAPSFAAVPRTASCSPYGGVCDYPQGRCQCNVPAGPFPVDAAAAAVWLCQDPASGCPSPRPLYGSACTDEGLRCDYGTCDILGGTVEVCTGGVWTPTIGACPHAARP